MDTFLEQLVSIKKDAKTYLMYVLIALVAIALMATALWVFGNVAIVVVFLVLYGAYKLYSILSVEYEYIITNSTMDIDKITAKSSRKRILSFELSEVERIEKYCEDLSQDILNDCSYACNKDDENACVLIIHPDGKIKRSIVIAPDEKMRVAMKKFLPKYVAETLK